MKLEHIALTINDSEEIENFYCDILGMRRIRDFILPKDVSVTIFGVESDIEVSFLEKGSLTVELFVSKLINKNPIDHVCITVPDRELMIQKAQQKGYAYTRIKRPEFDLVFLKDKNDNLFELRMTDTKNNN